MVQESVLKKCCVVYIPNVGDYAYSLEFDGTKDNVNLLISNLNKMELEILTSRFARRTGKEIDIKKFFLNTECESDKHMLIRIDNELDNLYIINCKNVKVYVEIKNEYHLKEKSFVDLHSNRDTLMKETYFNVIKLMPNERKAIEIVIKDKDYERLVKKFSKFNNQIYK